MNIKTKRATIASFLSLTFSPSFLLYLSIFRFLFSLSSLVWFSGSSYAQFFFIIFPKVAVKCFLTVKPRLYGVKSSGVELRVTHLSYKSWQTVYMTNKKLVRLIGRLAGSAFFYCEVNLLAGPVFFANKHFFSPSGSNRSGRDNQSMRKHCWLGQRSQFFPEINARWKQGG